MIVGTGMSTEFGRIARMVESVEASRTPLQENLDWLGATLGKGALAVVGLVVVVGLARGLPIIELLVFGIALAVAVVPEALPAVVTISLAIGVQRMIKRHALVRRLPAVETLGSTSIICSDKTGTLTKDEMTVRQIFTAGQLYEVTGVATSHAANSRSTATQPSFHPQLRSCSRRRPVQRCPDHLRRGRRTLSSRRSDRSGSGRRGRQSRPEKRRPRPRISAHSENPFSSETKRMTTLHGGKDGPVAYSKGAAEILMEASAKAADSDGEAPLDDERRQRFPPGRAAHG